MIKVFKIPVVALEVFYDLKPDHDQFTFREIMGPGSGAFLSLKHLSIKTVGRKCIIA